MNSWMLIGFVMGAFVSMCITMVMIRRFHCYWVNLTGRLLELNRQLQEERCAWRSAALSAHALGNYAIEEEAELARELIEAAEAVGKRSMVLMTSYASDRGK